MSPQHSSFPALVGKLVNIAKTLEADFSVSELDVMLRGLHIAVAKLQGLRNSMQPVNRLPPELLAQIFVETQFRLPGFLPLSERFEVPYAGLEWLFLLQVCRHWRGVVASTPALWSTVYCPAYPLEFLCRSRDADLTVYLGLRLGDGPILPSLEALAPHTNRFRECHFLVHQEDPQDILKHKLFSSPVPRLKSLLVEAGGREDLSSVLPPIFCGHMPKLKQLALSYFTSWPKHYFHNLTYLCLYNQRADSLPSTTEFLDFLKFSPRMEELALVRGGPLRPLGIDAPSPGRIISLNRLRKLDLGEWPSASTVARFLSHLSLPRKTEMYIWGNFLRDDEDVGSILPQDLSNLPSLERIKELYFIRQTEPPYAAFKLIAIADSALHLTGGFHPSQIHSTAISRYPLNRVKFLRLREDPTQFRRLQVSHWRSLLRLVPALRSLDIIAAASPQCTRAVLSALRPPKLFPPLLPTLDSVLCPMLRTIEITEELDLPFLHICNLTAERLRFNAPEIKFTFRGWSPPRQGYAVAAYDSDSDTDLEYGFDSFALGTHKQSVEYVKFTEPLRIAPTTWPTKAFNWCQTAV